MEPINGGDLGLFAWFIEHLWVPLITGIGFIGKAVYMNLTERMDKIEAKADKALPRDRFDEHMEDQREYRAHREIMDQRLYDKIDDHARESARSFESLRNMIMDRMR
jgi:hypothetical protein